jgi:2',3'-cyclic-nucleotide 2'-phosphodiesterase (5'-nucleotidase family)
MPLTAFLIGAALVFPSAQSPADTTTIVIAATTDVHGRVMAWDYERDRAASLGLVRAATVVDSLRRAHPGRVVLVDAGDLIQGNPFATYWARHVAPVHPIVDALNRMQYDAAAPGNHEFNFGLGVMQRALAGARYAVLSANIVHAADSTPVYQPSLILERAGVRIGIVGATTPGVLVWDGPNVRGQVTLLRVADVVPPEVRRLRAAGADVTVLVVHAGLDGSPSYAADAAPPENDVAATIAASGDLDVAVIGHTHREIADSTVGRTLVVQARNWAQSVAVVELTMVRSGGHWRVARKHGTIVPLADVAPDPALVAALTPAHDSARDWATQPVGLSADRMSAARARLEDTPVTDFVNAVMRARTGADLSATAVFNTTGSIPAGAVTRADLAGIYPYDNTLRAVRISGADLRAFLEFSARYYRSLGENGPVVNDSVRDYNFDIVSGAEYELDLTRPVGQRVVRLSVNGRDVRADDSFTLALNNYRAQGGGGYVMVAHAPVVYDRAEDIRDLLADEITRRGTIHAADYFVPSWRLRGFAPQRDSILLRVFATNDVHGALDAKVAPWSNGRPVGGVANIAGMMNRLAAECACTTIRLDGGDVMQGSAASNLTHGRAMVDVFNAMHVDAAAIGNHEFDWSIDTLAARSGEARFAWLSANIRESATRRRPAWAVPMTIVQAGSTRVAVVGYTTPGTATSTNPDNVRRLGFQGASALDSAIAAARAQRPDFVIVVAHEGAFCNNQSVCQGEIVDLAASLTNKPDLIVSGHTHSLVNTIVNGIPIVQARSSGTAIGIVDFVAQDSGRVVRIKVETVWADRERPDSAVAAVVARYSAQVWPMTSRAVARLGQDLPRRGDQYPLGDMVADALRESARADIALVNNTGIRADLSAGPVTWGQLYEVLPFGNFVVKMPVTGAVLRQTLEHALASNETRVSIAGMSVRVDRLRPPGQRVAAIVLADGRTVQDDAVYQLATFDFLAAGGSGYSMLRNRPFTNTGTDELDAFIAWLGRQSQPIRAAEPFVPRISDR